MDTPKPATRIHPLIAIAAIAVSLVSLVGVAAITGLLPSSNSTGSLPQQTAMFRRHNRLYRFLQPG